MKSVPLLALPLLGAEPFVVVNGDVWTDYPLERLVHRAVAQEPQLHAHLVLVRNPAHNPRGDFVLAGDRIDNASEGRHTFSGLSVHRPQLFAGCAPGHFPLLPLWRGPAMVAWHAGAGAGDGGLRGVQANGYGLSAAWNAWAWWRA